MKAAPVRAARRRWRRGPCVPSVTLRQGRGDGDQRLLRQARRPVHDRGRGAAERDRAGPGRRGEDRRSTAARGTLESTRPGADQDGKREARQAASSTGSCRSVAGQLDRPGRQPERLRRGQGRGRVPRPAGVGLGEPPIIGGAGDRAARQPGAPRSRSGRCSGTRSPARRPCGSTTPTVAAPGRRRAARRLVWLGIAEVQDLRAQVRERRPVPAQGSAEILLPVVQSKLETAVRLPRRRRSTTAAR